MKQQMTHNEYMEFLQKNAARLHTDNGYTMEDYKRDADNVDILGFDLERFGLSAEMQKVINDGFESDSVNGRGHTCMRGHYFDWGFVSKIANGLECDEVASGAYNGFFKNDSARLVLSWCEGDITLVLCDSKEAYFNELDTCFKFYKVDWRVFVEGAYNLYLDGEFVGKAFTEKEVKDFILRNAKENGAEKPLCVLQDRKNEYNDSSVDVSFDFFNMLNDRLPGAEGDARIEVSSPQECANLFGKLVKDGDKVYVPDMEDTTLDDKASLLVDFFWAQKITMVVDVVNGHLFAHDDEGNSWKDAEIYDFALNECLCFNEDGSLSDGLSEAMPFVEQLKEDAKAYGVSITSIVKSIEAVLANASERSAETAQDGTGKDEIVKE